MAKRYGRNRRRGAREEIEALKKRIRHESIACLYVLEDDTLPDIKDFFGVKSYTIVEDGGVSENIRFTASLDLVSEIPLDTLYDLIDNNGPIQFKGRKYIITNAERLGGETRDTCIFTEHHMTLNLVAIA